MWHQQAIQLSPKSRGFHLITDEVCRKLPPLSSYRLGLLHLFIQHTSASLSINENADPTVRQDMESHLNVMVPENASYYKHIYEGADDMPAHIKTALMGTSISLPINNGRLSLGTWQGIYLGEHRDNASARSIVATLQGATG